MRSVSKASSKITARPPSGDRTLLWRAHALLVRRVFLLLLIVPALALSGCLSWPGEKAPSPVATLTPKARPEPEPVPAVDPQEVAIAEAEHPKILLAYGGIYQDAAVDDLVGRTVTRLVAGSTEPWRSYRVTILNSQVVNAFALPGGYLYLTRGLLALASDTSELAAVIAHEMAHVTQRHAFARARHMEAVQVAGQVADQVLNNNDQAKTAVANSQRSLAAFSQAQELEADQIGIETMAKAGYDPFAASRFLHAMATYNSYRNDGQPDPAQNDFLSTHPSTPERESLAYDKARELNLTTGERGTDEYLGAIEGMLYGDDPEQGYVRNHQFLHARLGLAFQVPDQFQMENTSKSVLATDRSGIALRFDGTTIPDGDDLVSYINSGWIAGIDDTTVRMTSLNGLPAATASATNRGFDYRVCVVRFGSGVYRFLFAARRNGPDLDRAFAQTIASFRPMTPNEQAALHPLKIHVVTVTADDSVLRLASRMVPYTDHAGALIRALNQLGSDQEPRPGDKIKVIAP